MPRFICALLSAILIAGCANTLPVNPALSEANALFESGNIEEGLARLQEAQKADPGNQELRAVYYRQRDAGVQRYLALADQARSMNLFEQSEEAYRRALALDPENARAKTGLETLGMDRRHRALLAEAEAALKQGNARAAYLKVKEILAQNSRHREAAALLRKIEEKNAKDATATPRLAAALRKPVTLDFRDAGMRQVFEVISKHAGLNFIFDQEVPPDLRTTLLVRNTTIDDVIRFILVTNQLERKVLNENTILIYPNTPAKNQNYKDLVVRSFYLANADVKQTANMVRSLVKTKDIHVDEKLNMLMIRDTPEAVRVAEQLVANQDLAEPEVMLEVEVLEVGASSLQNLGIKWPDQLGVSVVGAAGTPGTITLPEWLNRNAGLVRLSFNDPLLLLSLKKQDGSANILANPRIRVKNKEKARIHIGDRVPVITASATATGFISESVNYLDVGLKLEVEPQVFLEDEVGIKIGLEVSNIAREIRNTQGTLTYQVGTRNAATTLRLKDGETQVLAGLINNEDRRTADKVPGLGDLPVLGRAFSNSTDTANRTEIVLLITPRVVRNLTRPEARLEEFASGTETDIGSVPLTLPSVNEVEGTVLTLPPGAQDRPAPAPRGTPATRPGAAPRGAAPPAAAPAPVPTSFRLQGPARVNPDEEFAVHVGMETALALRKGSVDVIFDASRFQFVRIEPGQLITSADASAQFGAKPQGGRLEFTFSANSDIKGSGPVARLIFRAKGAGPSTSPEAGVSAGAAYVRLQAISVTDAGGKTLSAQAPAPVTIAVGR
jgi:general secretion pathway protein D